MKESVTVDVRSRSDWLLLIPTSWRSYPLSVSSAQAVPALSSPLQCHHESLLSTHLWGRHSSEFI